MPSDAAHPDAHNALAVGERLHEFEIRGVLGVGGFGIVYTAFDTALEREVALKEYMPASLAARSSTRHVSVLSQSHVETFALGLRSFVNEARLLARFDHPALVKVHRFWEDNGTAYMVMPLYRGRTLRDARAALGAPPDEPWLRSVLLPLLGALGVLHRDDIYHRDIAPDNILLLLDTGAPLLLDFGAARKVITDKSQALTAILKPHYAPIEQYGETPGLRQGPWTDIYALGATLHYLVTGAPPMPATARMLSDDLALLAAQPRAGISERFLQLVDWMLAPRPSDRPQSVDELRQALDGQLEIPVRVAAPVTSSWVRTQMQPGAARTAPPPTMAGAMSGADDPTVIQPRRASSTSIELPLGDDGSVPPTMQAPPRTAPKPAPAPVPVPAPARSGGGRWVAIGAVALVGAAAGAWWLGQGSATPGGVPVASQGPAVTTAAPSPPTPAPAASAAPVIVPAAAPSTASTAAPAPSPATSPVAPNVPKVAAAERPADRPAAPTAAQPAAPRPAPSQSPSPASPRGNAVAANSRPAPDYASPSVTNGAAGPFSTSPAPAPAPAYSAPPPPAPAPAVAAPPPPAAAAEAAPLDPRERCGGRMLIALHRCLLRTCEDPAYARHKECVRALKLEEDNRRQRF